MLSCTSESGTPAPVPADREAVKGDVIAIIARELEVPVERLQEETSLQEDLAVDSLEVINIGLALEEKFQVRMDDRTISEFKRIGQIVDNLLRELAFRGAPPLPAP